MKNFQPLLLVLNEAASSIEGSNELLRTAAEHWLHDFSREGMLARSVLEHRTALARQLRECVETHPPAVDGLVQYTPELETSIEEQLKGVTYLNELLDRLQQVDRAWHSAFQILASSDHPPQINELCKRTAETFENHLKAWSLMQQTNNDW